MTDVPVMRAHPRNESHHKIISMHEMTNLAQYRLSLYASIVLLQESISKYGQAANFW